MAMDNWKKEEYKQESCMKIFKRIYGKSQCPNCKEYCITFADKMKLADFRRMHYCPNCKEYIKLPAWHDLLAIIETVLFVILAVTFRLNGFPLFLAGIVFASVLTFLQLPFIPISN